MVSLTNNNWQKVTTTTPLANSPSKTKISPQSNYNNPYTYTGRRFDNESGLSSNDPKGFVDGYNIYAYVENNPLKYTDPFGLRGEE
ncbi:hypothetical protein THERMOT_172 [Bathymodiolus thermophilus thioautotrophic gill symbiont]|uniref:hypothetical protein n=1 Tax=Bathymodiolus thermophilus thioautotrophic gill symbiont TaxID=2360 RepID=UPI00192B47B4|nr:hypothetical protein [Bathymodiolus thermophilus thioautotrophic gill symbiont]CAB5494795.1 hypothetical protein THERMOT_172 [Bathymodiolus thermophilus thioautotrophic gill symbiont]